MLRRGGGGAAKYKARNQVHIFYMIKCTEDFKVTLHTHLVHPVILTQT